MDKISERRSSVCVVVVVAGVGVVDVVGVVAYPSEMTLFGCTILARVNDSECLETKVMMKKG